MRAGLRALLPLAGQTLIEYQARCLAALGAAPLLVLVERVPVALNDAFERLRGEGIAVVAVSDGERGREPVRGGHRRHPARRRHRPRHERCRRGSARTTGDSRSILTVPDDDDHDGFERIDATHRWAGLARLPAGAGRRDRGDDRRLGPPVDAAAPRGPGGRAAASRRRAARARDRSWPTTRRWPGSSGACCSPRAARAATGSAAIILPLVEEVATERLMETRLRPEWLVRVALALTVGAALAFTRGWLWQGLVALVARDPARPRRAAHRVAAPAPVEPVACRRKRLLWPAAGLALVALGWFEARHGGGWGAMVAALAAAAFAEAMRIERSASEPPGALYFFSRRAAIWLAIPFAIGGLVERLSRRWSRSMPRRVFSSPSIIITASRAIDAELTPIV